MGVKVTLVGVIGGFAPLNPPYILVQSTLLVPLFNWIFSHFADKRLNKEPMEFEISGFSELIEANSHF